MPRARTRRKRCLKIGPRLSMLFCAAPRLCSPLAARTWAQQPRPHIFRCGTSNLARLPKCIKVLWHGKHIIHIAATSPPSDCSVLSGLLHFPGLATAYTVESIDLPFPGKPLDPTCIDRQSIMLDALSLVVLFGRFEISKKLLPPVLTLKYRRLVHIVGTSTPCGTRQTQGDCAEAY